MNNKNLNEIWLQLAATISEGIVTENSFFSPIKNMFGRTMHYSSAGDLAFGLGLASTGLRVAALLDEKSLSKNINIIKQATRQHIPFVILAEAKKENCLQKLSGSNTFQLSAENFQETIDFTIIAHRIAEMSLIPAVVIWSEKKSDGQKISIPDNSILLKFLGDADDRIASPSPAQQIIFGKTRRRIPNWFNPDIPVLNNAAKDEKGLAFETAANEVFFNAHLEEFVFKAFEEFGQQTGKKYKPSYTLNVVKSNQTNNIPFTVNKSHFPKHEVLLQAIIRDYPELKNKSINTINHQSSTVNHKIPLSIRKYKDQSYPYSRLSRFYDDTALFYENENSELVADPFQAIPVMPPATANFGFALKERKFVPVFDPMNCTGCGNCFVQCPHSALPPVALNLESIIKSGIQISQSKGNIISQMMPLQKGWVKASCNEIKERKDEIKQLKDFLPSAFNTLVKQMKLEGEKLETVSKEMTMIVEAVGDLPVAVTEKFFHEKNNVEKGSGELFTLAVDLNACTGCGICADVCDEKAIVMEAPTEEIEKKLHRDFSLWEQLPDTSGNTISRLIDDADYSSLAAILLSRNFYLTMTGGSSNEETASVKSMLHLVFAMAEFSVQPKYQQLEKIITENIEALSANIKKELGDALPSGNFNGLGTVLEKATSEKISIDEILTNWNGKEHLKTLDRASLQRKIDLVKSLTDLNTIISNGASGCGRSRYGMVLDISLASLAFYPWNYFTTPVILSENSSPEMAHGIIHGQIRHILDNLKLLRRATLEAQNKYNPSVHDFEIANLNWNDLSEEEKSAVPPILLIANRSIFRESGSSSLNELLNTSLPVKIIILDDCVPPVERMAANISETTSQILSAISSGNTFVAKSSLAAPEHLFSVLCNGLKETTPALFWLFTPNISAHTITNNDWTKMNSLAWNSRAFTHFDFNPKRESKLFSSKIEITANPFPNEEWNISKIKFLKAEEEQTMDYAVTFADWSYSIKEWKEKFSPYKEQNGTATTVADFIKLDKNSRNGKIPVIIRVNEKGELMRYTVSKDIIEATEAAAHSWNMMREIAGTLTEFPEKLEQAVEKTLSVKFEEEKKKLSSEYENKISNLEAEHLEKIRVKLREKLVALSKSNGN